MFGPEGDGNEQFCSHSAALPCPPIATTTHRSASLRVRAFMGWPRTGPAPSNGERRQQTTEPQECGDRHIPRRSEWIDPLVSRAIHDAASRDEAIPHHRRLGSMSPSPASDEYPWTWVLHFRPRTSPFPPLSFRSTLQTINLPTLAPRLHPPWKQCEPTAELRRLALADGIRGEIVQVAFTTPFQ